MKTNVQITILSLAVALALGVGMFIGYAVHPEVQEIAPDSSFVTIKGQRIKLGPDDDLEYSMTHTKDIEASTRTFEGSGASSSAKMDAIGYNGVVGKSLMSLKTSPAEISVGGAKGTLASTAYSASMSVNNGPLLILIVGCLMVFEVF